MNSVFESLKKNFQEETLPERSARMFPAAGYGALVATVYILTLSFINVYTFPNLPLGMDWVRVLEMWLGFSSAFAFLGASAAWFTEEHHGIIGGGIIFTALLAIIFMFSPNIKSDWILQSLIMALPLIGVNVLGAWGLRWSVERHLKIKRTEVTPMRQKLLARHVLTMILIGLIPGILGRMGTSSERTITKLHELLQAAPSDPSAWTRLPSSQAPSLQDHFGVKYVLYVQPSYIAAGAMDVTVRFVDGYTLICLLPEGNDRLFITTCYEENTVEPNP